MALIAGLAIDARGQPVRGAENEATQLGALRELLDRGFGRAPPAVALDPSAPSPTATHLIAARLISRELLLEVGSKTAATPAEPQPVADLMALPPPIE